MESQPIPPKGKKELATKKKSSVDKKEVTCRYFTTPSGCLKGEKCNMKHVGAPSVKAPEAAGAAATAPVDVVLSVKPTVVATLGEFFSQSTTPASKDDEAVFQYAESDARVAFPAKWSPVAHPLSHLYRMVAERDILAAELRGLKKARVLAVYGAGRDKRLEKLAGYTKQGAKLTVEPDVSVTVDCGPDEQYPGDAGKTELRVAVSGLYEVVVATDVYWGGRNAQGESVPFGPDEVAHYCRLSRVGSMFIITRMFSGYVGCDVVAGYKGPVEGVWIKDERTGLVSFSPDSSRFGYPQHYDMEWLRNKSVPFRGGSLSVTFISKCGPYEVVKVVIDPPNTLQVRIDLQELDVGNVQLVTAPRSGLYNWMIRSAGVSKLSSSIFPGFLEAWTTHTTTYLCHTQSLSELRPMFALKSGGGHNQDSAVAMVKRTMYLDPVIQEVAKRYPTVIEKIMAQTSDALLFSTKVATAERLDVLRSDHSRAEAVIVAARAPVFTLPRPSRLGRAACAGLLLLGVIKMGLIFGAHAAILSVGEGDAKEPWLLGGIIILAFIVAGVVTNCRFTRRRMVGRFETWEEKHWCSEENTDIGSGYEGLPAGSFVRAVDVQEISDSIGLGKVSILHEGTALTVRETFDALGRESMQKVSYAVAVTNAMLFQPNRTDVNLLAAIVQRLHVSVCSGNEVAWAEVYRMIDQLIVETQQVEWSIEDCAKAMGGVKGINLLASMRELEDGHLSRHRKKIMVKWNETIGLKLIEGKLSIKPRAIVVLSNEVHAILAPHARGFSDALHNLFDGSVFNGIRVYYASGYSGAKLDAIGKHAYAYEDFIAASGDDSICCFYQKANIDSLKGMLMAWLFEGDFAAMDQSEKEEAIKLHCKTMVLVGMPHWIADFYAAICRMSYVAKGHAIMVSGDVGAQLATGIDFTTVCNSLTTIMFWLLAYSHINVSPVDVAASLGLTLKLKRHDWADQCTFLKGWWQPLKEGGIVWCPLPSQVIKLGKIMREPRLFSPTKDENDGVRRAAWATAMSMPTIPEDYPILGPFLKMLRTNGTENGSVLSASEDGWYKPVTTAGSIDRIAVLNSIQQRYSLQMEEIVDCENLLNDVDVLPVFLAHPVFLQLAAIDYY